MLGHFPLYLILTSRALVIAAENLDARSWIMGLSLLLTLARTDLGMPAACSCTELTEENVRRNARTVGWLDGENNSGDGQADLEIKMVDTLDGLSMQKTAAKWISVESIDENVSVRTKINGSQSYNENPENNEVDSAEGNSEAVEITYIDDSRNPMNMKAESRLDSKFIYSKGYGESGMTTLEPVKKIINESSHGTLEHSGKAIVEMDVERVLEEQDTHDLYCPNCNSCITKRVILRKRKRIIHDVQFDTKRERIEPLLQPGLLDSPAATDEASHDTGPDSPQQTAARNLSWISAIFETFRVKNARNEPGMETAECVQKDSLQTSGQFQNSSETQTDETIDCVFPVQGGPMPGRSNANVVESVGSEIQNPSQEANQGPSEPGETQVADVMKWDGLIKSNGTDDPNPAVHDHPKLKGQLQDSEEVPPYQNKDEVSPMKAGLREIISFMDMKPVYNSEQKTLEDGMNPPQKPDVLSHGDANFVVGEVLNGVSKANISSEEHDPQTIEDYQRELVLPNFHETSGFSRRHDDAEGDNLQPVKEDVNAEHVNPSFQNEGNEFTVSEIPSATNDENSIKSIIAKCNSDQH
ncbi:hypothetical protein ACLOJK_032184 [Asimina triloba]